QVIWVPSLYPPHKLTTKFAYRSEMVQEAIADHPAFIISPLAKNDSGPTYAIQTLLDLQAFYPNTYWYWIVGLDTFQTLPHWYRRQEIALACDWLVVPRGGGAQSPSGGSLRSELCKRGGDCEVLCQEVVRQLGEQGIGIRWQLLQMPLVDISSSLIRQYCRARISIRYLVPEVVRTYIAAHNLYSDGTG
ncbi:MAG: nicotinate (nicotinamide) nucleotide adenylyltransferase, partial [Chroococcidiopsidaceae cyanobacterium CP_BM_RX_35]|nr:nicotinate (nicotinamide) nucleotide adenylyltransferase [Chroococcidiopsidaceae cyanobacterium CP_BM_RX_35]